MEGTEDIHVTVEEEAEAPHLKSKENDQSVESRSCNVMGASAVVLATENDWAEPLSSLISADAFAEALGGKSEIWCTDPQAQNEKPSAGPCTMTDSGVVVEELTLNNYRRMDLSTAGCSNSQEAVLSRKGKWHHLYQLAGGLKIGNSPVDLSMETDGREDAGIKSPTTLLAEKPQLDKHPDEVYSGSAEPLIRSNNCTVSRSAFTNFPGGIRTKYLPASGFSHFFVKNTLKGKGTVYRHFQNLERSSVVSQNKNSEKSICDGGKDSNTLQGSNPEAHDIFPCDSAGVGPGSVQDGISLREWLKSRSRKISKVENMNIFKQILKLVDTAHSQGFSLQDARPSCFMLLSSERVKYIGSWAPQTQTKFLGNVTSQDPHSLEHHLKRKRPMEQGILTNSVSLTKNQKLSGHLKLADQLPKLSATFGWKSEAYEDDADCLRAPSSGCNFREPQILQNRQKSRKVVRGPSLSNCQNPEVASESILLEKTWYTSPEILIDSVCSLESNIYSLGVLLFELFCRFESCERHSRTMSNLRHRILPPYFLSENPKEAGFCLWLLHPEPSSRPKTSEILQSELICEVRDLSSENHLSLSIDEKDAESELLLYFLMSLEEQKNKQVSELVEKIGCLNADIEEVEKRHLLSAKFLSQTCKGPNENNECFHSESLLSKAVSTRSPTSYMEETILVRNIKQLENAYFSIRSKIELLETDVASRLDNDIIKKQDRWCLMQNGNESCSSEKPTDRLGAFFKGICKYARYSKFEVRGILRNGDLLNSANVICSLSFDRDEDYFATAGVSKKIKIFEFSSLLNDTVDIHYPVVEMSCKSKLSCVSWNNYIKNYLASTDYDGVVQLWDASTGQGLLQYKEHQKRAWSVDFSRVDPKTLASGSDDCSVRLWSISELNCTGTIRNAANVCCVQFSSHSTHLLAFGSADYKIHCYDLRTTRIPWCTLAGHGKAVSYVKFLDPCTIVSASTDNTLKIWDLNKTTSSGLSTNACSLTLRGHTNEKNFVGLSVSDGYIACGSETNEVYAYYRSLPMPITSHKFGSFDPVPGQDTVDDSGHFVSSVFWSGKSNMVVAANSNGCIKLLQMV